MKPFLFFALCMIILPCYLYSQSINWEWARSINGPSNEDEIDAVASDYLNNVYLSGKFEDSLYYAGSSFPMISAGMADIMLIKYDSIGNLIWAKQFGGIGEDNTFDAVCDQNNNVIISGYFQNTIAFDSVVFTSLGGFDFFLVKLDPNGNLIWAKQYGGSGDDGGNEVSTDYMNRIIVSADSDGQFNTDSFSFNNTGNRDSYVISLNEDGTENWARAIQGIGAAQGKSVAVDNSGNVYFGGSYLGPNAVIDQSSIAYSFNLAGSREAFLTAWTEEGNYKWHKTWGGSSSDLCKGIATNNQGELFVMGPFSDDVNLDGNIIDIGSEVNFYLWKLDSNGVSIWVRHIASPGDILEGGEIISDGHNGVFFGIGMIDAVFLPTSSSPIQLTMPSVGAYPVLINYTDSGDVSFTKLADQSFYATFGEISLSGNYVFLDFPYFGTSIFGIDTLSTSANSNKDGGIVCIKIPNNLLTNVNELVNHYYERKTFEVYPNPANNQVKLTLPKGEYSISIFNSNGQNVLNRNNASSLTNIDIAELATGTYFIQALIEKTVYTSKFVKQ